MKIAERIQAAIHMLEVGFGSRVISVSVVVLTMIGLAVMYDTRVYHNFSAPEAMDAAQVARNLAEGHGYTTDFIRPFSVFLLQKHNHVEGVDTTSTTNAPAVDAGRVNSPHPDLANAPVYPVVLAGLFKLWTPPWQVELRKPFWSEGGSFRRYQPEFGITIFNQLLLVAIVVLTFQIARKLFDPIAAWLSAGVVLGSDLLWKFSVSGQSTLLLLVIFLGLAWCLIRMEELGCKLMPNFRKLFLLALAAGVLTGVGMLTRYSFGWLIVPVIIYVALFGGERRAGLAVAAFLAFALVVSPWILRNLAVSGTLFGTAGYAVAEGTYAFPGTRLLRSLHPDMTSAYWIATYERKLMENLRYILQGDLFHIGGVWAGILFFAGLMMGIAKAGARRLRYFALMCLGVLIVIEALGRTQLAVSNSETSTENLLVLLTPFTAIFAVAAFMALLERMEQPSIEARFGAAVVLALLVWQPFVSTITMKTPPVSYPPYYPPDVQKISNWMRPDELTMSDIPWAVAWYGNRPCTWTTINSQYEFFQFNDYVKPIHALYLSLNTLDGKLFSECLQGGVDSWGNFVLKTVAANQLPPGFPLKNFPLESLLSGLYLTDRQRWE